MRDMVDAMNEWVNWADRQLDDIRAAGRWRATRSFDANGPSGRLGGREVVSYASNDYLGLSSHPRVVAAAHDAIDRWGAGATASRLIVGSRPCHHDLEDDIAAWKGSERALLFPTGYAANLGVLGALGGPDVTVYSDELNHASIIDGCRLGRSTVVVYRHADIEHLEALLGEHPGGRQIVVTDGVFSMDGDDAPLHAIAEACVRHGALLVVDEAHSVLAPAFPDIDALQAVRVGTLSKTLGTLGGWVAASASFIDLFVNRSRTFIFTTGLSPADTAGASAALDVLRSAEGADLLARLRHVIDRLAPGHPSPIVPIVIGDEDRAVKASAALLERGILVPAIRPPTVPPGTSRLRIALSAAHTDAMLDDLITGLDAMGLR
jgi:8-amino-7-oxononanoate synthase